MKIAESYPAVFAFFDGAFSANSGGKATEADFQRYNFTHERLAIAETELKDFCDPMGLSYRALGMQADSGYTVCGQTRQEDPKDPSDTRYDLVVYELLDEVY